MKKYKVKELVKDEIRKNLSYLSDGNPFWFDVKEVEVENRPSRYIGRFYVFGKKVHTTSDFDTEDAVKSSFRKFILGLFR